MLLAQLLALSLALSPNLVSAAIFPDNTLVKMIDHKGFKNALKENMTSMVAFVAPWCGHCQKMAPEYSKAALGLHPLVPLYAVDCDAAKNKRLCADQGVKGFPTVKLFPRGKTLEPIEFQNNERTASAFYYFGKNNIPKVSKKIRYIDDWDSDVNAKDVIDKHRAIVMLKSNKMPILWQALANKYSEKMAFFNHRDRRGKSSVTLGFEAGGDEAKVLIIPAGETKPSQYMGILKFDSLSRLFDSLIDGSADLSELNAAAAAEEFTPDPVELEIERQQEAEMLRLAHGGFSDMIDFEAAVRDGSAASFHKSNGYGGMMGPGSIPEHLRKDKKEGSEEESDSSSSSSTSKKARMPMTGDAGQIVLEAKKSKMPETAKVEATDVPEPVSMDEPEATGDARTESLSTPEPDLGFKEEVEPEEVVVQEDVPEDIEADSSQPSAGVESERHKDEL